MKKIFLFALFVLPLFCASELFLEITKGSEDPFKVAMIPFAGNASVSKKLNEVIRNDLSRTGEFSLLDERLLLPLEIENEEINYQDWRLLGMDYLVVGNIVKEKNSIDVSYEIYDIQKRRKIRSSKVFGLPNQLRQLAHYTSDGIYESIAGIKGIASTKLLYVNEIKSEDIKSRYRLMLADSDGANEQTLLSSSEPIISPSWSPDGKYLSLTIYQDGNAEIYILRLRDQTLTRMTNQFAIDTESSWSPKGNKILFTSGRSGSPQIYELDLRRLNSKAKRISFEGSYNAKASYLPNEEGIIFVHRSTDGLFHIALKYKKENFIRILTEAKMDESPSVAPNGNMVIYGITEGDQSMLAGFSLSGATFKLPASQGEVREPAWSNFLR